jgi:hypothetical protein
MLYSFAHQERKSYHVADIFNFSPKNELQAAANLEKFIEQCKTELTVFGGDLNWEEWKWPKAANFSKLGSHSRTKDEADKLDESFISFAKAYFRYQQGHKPTGTKNELKALRAIELALLQSGLAASVTNISIATLDQAAQIIGEHYSKGAAYHGGRELERLATFVTSKRLVEQNISDWKSPLKREKDLIQTGQKAKERRESKMPSEDALAALAEIFSNSPTKPQDIFISSTFAMLMCAPSRITEILELPVDCEIEQLDSKGITRYGWRFYSGKGFGADIKWIPTEMVSVAKEAIFRLKKMTETSRQLSLWIEQNPNKFYRYENCPGVADDQPLSMIEASRALGMAHHTRKAAQSALNNCELETKDDVHTLSSLWRYVLSRQPKEFPWISQEKGIKYSNALFCMQRNLLHEVRGTSPVILWKPTNNVFNNNLSPRYNVGDSHTSIFDRYGYKTSDGERIKLTSHQARHLLNTVAQRGGVSQLQIAKWSGRAEASQNRTYNHMSEYEMVALAEELDTSLTLFGPSGEVTKHIPISIQEFNTMEKGAVHVTEFGVCVHDFTMTPCDKYRDCLNCSEQVCIKGDSGKLARIRARLEEVNNQYLAAEKAMADGLAGADRWYEYHSNTLGRLKELLSILENPSVVDGAQIKLRNDKAFSPLRRAIESKNASPKLGKDAKDKKLLEDMTKMLGGGFG